jgi:hypothetical protein
VADSGPTPDAAAPDAATCAGVETIADERVQPGALATDGTSVYWAEPSGSSGLGNVLQARSQGGHVLTIAVNQPSPSAMAVDDAFLYWANQGTAGAQLGGSIVRLSKLGGLPAFLAFDQPPPQGITLDGTSVYYTAGANVVAVNKLGGPLQVLAIGVSPTAVAVDSSAVYYGDATPLGGAQTLGSVPKYGGFIEVLEQKVQPTALVVDAETVYWVNFWNGTLQSVPKTGGAPTTLVSGVGGHTWLAVDGTLLYFTTASEVKAVPKAGGKVATIASGLHFPHDLALDTKHVYWATQSTLDSSGNPVADGAIQRACK